MNPKLQTFYSILGKTLGLVIVGAEAYAQAKTGGGSSLLQPANLATLIGEVENVLVPAPAAPAPPVAAEAVIEPEPLAS
jgi:hypothetical protein